MLRGLHWRLSLLYGLASAVLLLLAGGGAYLLLNYYFRSSTDLALQSHLVNDLRRLGAPVPNSLAAAEQEWFSSSGLPMPLVTPGPRPDGDQDHGVGAGAGDFDSALASIYELQLSAQGQVLLGPTAGSGLAPDAQAVAAALANGTDWRTTRLADGTPVRLLTYRVHGPGGVAVIQLGRTLSDVDRVLNSFLLGLLGLGAAAALFVGAASWWLAGRSLAPAHAAWEKQQTFVANASHELRTPLTLVRATAEVAQRGLPPGDARHELLGDILAECDHMGHLVEDLLLLSRLDTRSLKLERRPIAAAELLTEVQRQVGRLADERGVCLEVAQADGTLLGDPARVRQVLLIVLDNALRHTPAGGRVTLEATPLGRWVELTVSDTGAGIAPEHLPHLFERFYRADSARSGEGAGLGLAIARSLTTAQGGQIDIQSEVGQGTQVELRFPGLARGLAEG
jgi:signal transduction histidine kinase